MRFEKLGNVFPVIRNGANIKQDKLVDGYPITRIETIADGELDLTRVGYAAINDESYADFYLQENDILMSHINSVSHLGKVAIVDEIDSKVIHGMNLLCLKADKNKISPLYSFYFFKSPVFKSKLKRITKKSVNQASFNITNLKEIEIPVPSLPDQRHIARLLSQAEQLIAQRHESLRLLDAYLKSTFLEMFGDINGEPVPLTEACILNPKKSEIFGLDRSIEVSFIPMAKVSENGLVDLTETRALDAVWNGFTYFRDDDVVFAKITPCMENGKGAIMKNLRNSIGFGSTEFHVLRPISGISTSAWLYHHTNLDEFRKKAEQNMTGSAGQKRVPSDYFQRYKVVIPPYHLQTKFAEIVALTEMLKAQYRQSLAELEHLYGSLSQRAFRGELTNLS